MLVEINLLPQKEPRKYGFLAVLAIFTSLFFIVAVIYFWQVHLASTQLQTITKQISTTNKIVTSQNKQTKQLESSNSVSNLKNSINWVSSSRINTVPVLNELTSLLPERGFILSYQSEVESETVQLNVQFDTANDAAYYLNRLNHSKMVSESTIDSLNSSASTNSSSKSTNTSGAVTSSSSAVNSLAQSSAAGTTASQSFTSNNENYSTGTHTAVGAEQSTTQSNTTTSTLDKQELPRYAGQFTIKLNQAEIKKIENKGHPTEGVTGS